MADGPLKEVENAQTRFARELTGLMGRSPDDYRRWLPFVQRVWSAAKSEPSDRLVTSGLRESGPT